MNLNKQFESELPVFLIGFMGSGKTTFGRKLASHTQLPFTDTDKAIADSLGISITDIFKSKGETWFRHQEASLIRTLTEPCIVATGGGLPCFYGNMDWMNTNGTTVYLMYPVSALISRLLQTKQERPLLTGLSGKELEEKIANLFSEREAIYQQSKVVINGLKATPESVWHSVLQYKAAAKG